MRVCVAFGLLLTGLIIACNVPTQSGQPPPLVAISTSAAIATPTLIPATPTGLPVLPTDSPTPTATSVPELIDEWTPLADGLAQRILPVFENGVEVERLYVLRIDPAYYRFDVGYSPTAPKTLPQWFEETNADIVLNGGFFTAEYYATGLTVADGVASGQSYDFGGMVAIKDGVLDLRALSAEPYSPDLQLDAGLQSFPMLVNRDGSAAFTEPSVNRHRRTAIAQDKSGHVLFMVANNLHFTLTELSNFLAQSDLDLAIAFNLDGGPSSGIIVREPSFEIPSPVLLPTVLTVYRR